jgi:hypothetical protein
MITDTHADMLPDTRQRLRAFITEALQREVDFIIQLGDFCHARDQERDFLDIWNRFTGKRYHVLGNHDMDFTTKEETMDFWNMPSKWYSFDIGPFHFVVLDANYLYREGAYIDYERANFYVDNQFRTFVTPEQITWLKDDLNNTLKPVILFSHQSLINPCWGIKNRFEIQDLLEKVNTKSGRQKVVACFNGHDHIDFHRQLNGIHYIEINSAAYQWLGSEYASRSRYPEEMYTKFKHLEKVAPYTDSLYAFIHLDPAGKLKIEGIQSAWLGPSPEELGHPEPVYGCRYSACISDRNVSF